MKLTFDPDGGDLGRGVKVTALELTIVAPHIIEILQSLYNDSNLFFDMTKFPSYKYGFEVYYTDKEKLSIAMDSIRLSDNVHWYTCDDRKIFEMRGASGGIISALACYLVTGVKK